MGEFKTTKNCLSPRILIRYTLLQLPESAVFILVLILIRRWINIPDWSFYGLIAFWIFKDIIFFPFVWRAYDCDDQQAKHSMIGLQGFAADRLAPSGYIRIRGELWQAEVSGNDSMIEKGQPVRVLAIDGLKLLVQSEPKIKDTENPV
ncbi:MAG: NfeD family protein [Desulfobacterales bacterium]|nr:NfeD family protein [Desulfobacterales bacterium]